MEMIFEDLQAQAAQELVAATAERARIEKLLEEAKEKQRQAVIVAHRRKLKTERILQLASISRATLYDWSNEGKKRKAGPAGQDQQ